MTQPTRLFCTCGRLRLEVEREPIIRTECHCNSCRAAANRLTVLPVSPLMLEEDGGTRFVLYRKDRVRFAAGADLLRPFRLSPDAGTRRVVAGCCNTPVFLEFEGGHWLSLYARLWPEGAPGPELRTMTGDRADAAPLPGDIPAGRWHTARFYARLLAAWIAMGFRSPKITIGGQDIHA